MAKIKKYEYYVLRKDLCATSFDEEAFLQKMGNDGWKLVGVVATTNGKPTLYFRRKKADEEILPAKKSVKKNIRTRAPKQLKEVIAEIRLPREVILKRISEIIIDKLGADDNEVKEEASFTDDLGADSMDAVELLMEFEKEFNVGIPDDMAENVRTVKDAVDVLYKLINVK